MKQLFSIILLILCVKGLSQETIVRNGGESIDEMVNRYVEGLNSEDSTGEGRYFKILHDPVEIQFGMKTQKRIITVLQENYQSSVYLFEPSGKQSYHVEILGDVYFGLSYTDNIRSIFTYDYNRDGKKELFVLGNGGERETTPDGLSGCCVDVYDCFIYEEKEAGLIEEAESDLINVDLTECTTADEVKVLFGKYHLNQKIKNISSEEDLCAHLKRMDSIDVKYGFPGQRAVIDKIYELSIGMQKYKYKITSLTRKTDSSTLYSVGLFAKDSNGLYFYMESKPVEFKSVSGCKVESIFGYDADKDSENDKELIVLLSVTYAEGDKQFYSQVYSIDSDGKGISHREGWWYGLNDEKNVEEIKKSIEYFHEHKYDDWNEGSRD